MELLSYAKGIRPSKAKKELSGGSLTTTLQETLWETYEVKLRAKAVEKWDKARFDNLCIIGIRTANGYNFTVTQYDTWGCVGTSWVRPSLFVSLPGKKVPTPKDLFPFIQGWLQNGKDFLTTDPTELDTLYALDNE